MSEKILWGLIALVATFLGNFLSNTFLRRKDFEMNWKKLQMEKLQELYGLIVVLNEQNRKLFLGSSPPDHDKLRTRLVKWLDAYSDARLFFLKNRIIFSDFIGNGLKNSFDQLHSLGIKIMLEKNSLDNLESLADGIKERMYSNLQNEITENEKVVTKLAQNEKIEEIVKNMETILTKIYIEFRQFLK